MYVLVKNMGISDSNVLQVSQKINKKTFKLQKLRESS
ncbi:hypothetical protein [Alteribacillus persepolensis]